MLQKTKNLDTALRHIKGFSLLGAGCLSFGWKSY